MIMDMTVADAMNTSSVVVENSGTVGVGEAVGVGLVDGFCVGVGLLVDVGVDVGVGCGVAVGIGVGVGTWNCIQSSVLMPQPACAETNGIRTNIAKTQSRVGANSFNSNHLTISMIGYFNLAFKDNIKNPISTVS